MRINILQADQDKIILRVRFTNKELIDPKFTVAMAELEKDTKLTITPPKAEDGNAYRVKRNVPANKNYHKLLGEIVDNIRELFAGDVTYTYKTGLKDKDGNPLPDPKNYTKIPRFKVGETNTRITKQPKIDEKGEPVLQPVTDKDGKPVLDDKGEPVLEQVMEDVLVEVE